MPEISKDKYTPEQMKEIAALAALSTPGVSRMHMLPAAYLPESILKKTDRVTGVHMSRSGQSCNFEIYCDVAYGCRIPETAWNIQERVKYEIESKTDFTVGKINIHIEGITR